MTESLPLVDSFQRIHRNLRIGVTDRCNIRCFYCMPNEQIEFLPHRDLLTFEEIARFVRAVVPLGIQRVRITGGEPLVRRELWKLVEMLAGIEGLHDIALTTNGLLLADQAQSLKDAGLHRLNVSLDTIHEEVFQRIARRQGVQRVLDGIARAQQVGFEHIRLNAVSLKGITEEEVVPLARFARGQGLELRFIEFMPLDAEGNWDANQVLTGRQIREIVESEFGTLHPTPRDNPSQPALDWEYPDGGGIIGFINPVSEPFCSDCDRLRITSEGQLRNCLFSTEEWDAREVLRNGGSETELQSLVRDCIAHKRAGHGIDDPSFVRPVRSMYQIGG